MNKLKKQRWTFLVLFTFHTTALFILILWMQSSPYLFKDEASIIGYFRRIEFNLIKNTPSEAEDFVFLNLTYAKALLPNFDETGYLPIGNEVIVDRQKLIKLFENLDGSHKYIVLDVLFDLPSEYDEKLEALIKETDRVIIPYHLDDKGEPGSLVISTDKKGLADVSTVDGLFLKYQLMEGGHKSLPLVMYEDQINKEYELGNFFGQIDHHRYFNSFILNLRLTSYQLFEQRSLNYLQLDEYFLLSDENQREYLKGKIVVLGDFINDTVDSVDGDGQLPGSLLLSNAFIALMKNDPLITIQYMIFLILVVVALGFIVARNKDWLDKLNTLFDLLFSKFKKVKDRKWISCLTSLFPVNIEIRRMLTKSLLLFIFLLLVDCISYFYFSKIINLFWVFFYVSTFDYLQMKIFSN